MYTNKRGNGRKFNLIFTHCCRNTVEYSFFYIFVDGLKQRNYSCNPTYIPYELKILQPTIQEIIIITYNYKYYLATML